MSKRGSDVGWSSGADQSWHRRKETLHYAASFHCLMEDWQDCEELKPKPKRNEPSCRQNGGSNGVACGRKRVSLHVMRKKQSKD